MNRDPGYGKVLAYPEKKSSAKGKTSRSDCHEIKAIVLSPIYIVIRLSGEIPLWTYCSGYGVSVIRDKNYQKPSYLITEYGPSLAEINQIGNPKPSKPEKRFLPRRQNMSLFINN